MYHYQQALTRLAAYPWAGVMDLPNLMSVLRGPDDDDGDLKLTFTAPLRLYLLGAEAYKEVGYYPPVRKVSNKLPRQEIQERQCGPHKNQQLHFARHIYAAINSIRLNSLPPADSEKA